MKEIFKNKKFITRFLFIVLIVTILFAGYGFFLRYDAAIKKDYIDLVNAKYSQGQIVNMCRGAGMNTGLLDAIEKGEIRELKKTPEEFLTEYKSGVINYDNRLKVKFKVNSFNFEI